MSSQTTLLIWAASSLALVGCNEISPTPINAAPEVHLREQTGTLTMGGWATFQGTATDDIDSSEELNVTWSVQDRNGNTIAFEDLDALDNCSAPPVDSAAETGLAECTFRTPVSHTEIQVTLGATDSGHKHASDSIQVTLDAGESPTCSQSEPVTEHELGDYFEDAPIDIDGSCADASGETAPADLDIWFRDTYTDADGHSVTLEYGPGGWDTADTGAQELTLTTNSGEARLHGPIYFAAATHQLCLMAEDESGNSNGNSACQSFKVYAPNTAPICYIVAPGADDIGAIGAEVRFEAFVIDPDQDPSTLDVVWTSDQVEDALGYGTPDQNGFLALTEALVFDEQASHHITLTVTDQWGVVGTCSTDYEVADGPTVEVTYPTRGDAFDLAENIPLECEYSDAGTACADMLIEWYVQDLSDGSITILQEPQSPTNPSTSPPCTEQFAYDTAVGLTEGLYYFYCRVTDGEGNANSDGVFLAIDSCLQTLYQDLDRDGYGDPTITTEDCLDASGNPPLGWAAIDGDCDDSNATIFPGFPEQCNGLDDNCDGTVDEGFHLVDFYRDADGDGYGVTSQPYDPDGDGLGDMACSGATIAGYTVLEGDCDDSQPSINPGEAEQCDDTDHDCDGDIDNGFPYPYGTVLYLDADADNWGGSALLTCDALTGYIPTPGDCDDTDPSINPDALEVCNTTTPVDEDCDGSADPIDATGCYVRYLDADGDSYGTDLGTSACVCLDNPFSYTSENAGDCDDSAFTINPAATEVCDASGTDEDCDGYSDGEGAGGCSLYYYDYDGDNYYASGAASRCLCAPDGYYRGNISGDCNDSDPNVNPGMPEICDAANTDEDCDSLSDDADGSASGQTPWYRDADTDGYGLATVTLARCDQPSGYVSDDSDCDDTNDDIHPGVTETTGDGVDYDCDGTEICYDDDDNDGYLDTTGDTRTSTDTDCADAYEGLATDPTTDCDDTSAAFNPGVTETTGDGIDYNCDGRETCYADADHDGYRSSSSTVASTDTDCSDTGEALASAGVDCLDSNAYAFPGAAEYESSTSCREDADSDGYGDSAPPSGVTAGGDCNDGVYGINPGVSETTGDGVDYNCDSYETCYVDSDLDGYRSSSSTTSTTDTACTSAGHALSSVGVDCLDSNIYAFPGAAQSESSTSCREDADDDGYGDASPPSGVTAGGDCDDSRSNVYPGGPESTYYNDSLDNDCDSLVDENVPLTKTQELSVTDCSGSGACGPIYAVVQDGGDGDGNLDLAVACYTSNDVWVFPGTGSSTSFFSTSAKDCENSGSAPRSLSWGHINTGSNKDFVAVTASGDTYYSHLLNSSENFTTGSPVSGSLNSGSEPRAVKLLSDCDSDSFAEFMAVGENNTGNVSFWLNDGSSGWSSCSARTVKVASGSTGPIHMRELDINGDGKHDIITANGADGTIGIAYPSYSSCGACSGLSTSGGVAISGMTQPKAIAVEDFDSDGILDIAAVDNSTGYLNIYINSCTSTSCTAAFTYLTRYSLSSVCGSSPAPDGLHDGDFNHDGDADLIVTCTNTNSGVLFIGYGNGYFAPTTTFTTGSDPREVWVEDFDGDGYRDDFVVSNMDSDNIYVYKGGR
ncbi:MAG: MopE-related protein [Pseudomonadota bacterium]